MVVPLQKKVETFSFNLPSSDKEDGSTKSLFQFNPPPKEGNKEKDGSTKPLFQFNPPKEGDKEKDVSKESIKGKEGEKPFSFSFNFPTNNSKEGEKPSLFSSLSNGSSFNSPFSSGTSGNIGSFSFNNLKPFGENPEPPSEPVTGKFNVDAPQDNVVEKPSETIPSGEEEDIIVYEEKTKLYIFNEGWKPFAQGPIKINKNKTNNKSRIIMRKEGGLTIALNAPLFPQMKIVKQGDKSIIFPVPESTGNKKELKQYLAKFQLSSEAEAFFNKLEECKKV